MAAAFTERRMQALRPRVTRIVDNLLDQMIAGPRPADLVHAFSLPLPSAVICELLGVPATDLGKFHGWSDTLFGTWERSQQEMVEAYVAINGYMAGLIADKRERPADDLITVLIAARDEGDRLSEEELVRFCFGLLMAGHETTANQLSLSFMALSQHRDQLDLLRTDPGLIPGAVEELLRYVQMIGADAVSPSPRVTREQVRLGGLTIGASEVVMPLMNLANRDPSAFHDPDRLDVTRQRVCISSGGCVGAAPGRFALDDEMRSHPVSELIDPDESVRYAAAACPVEAISLTDAGTGEPVQLD